MTITIDFPLDGQPLGIGMSTQVRSDAGPVTGGWGLEAEIRGFGGRIIGFGQTIGLSTPIVELQIGRLTNVTTGVNTFQGYPQYPDSPHGSTVEMRARLRHPVDGIVEETTRSIKYDVLTGLQHWIANQAKGSGGYTDADRTVATNTLQSVQQTFASGIAGVPDAILGIGQMFASPPVEILRRAELLVLEGRGQLQYPAAGLEVQAYGALIGLDHLPPGIGFRDGFIKEYEVRIGQFVVYGRHGNTQLYVKNLSDINSVGHYFIWGSPFPRTIGYDVTPGIRLTWQWLVLGVQA